MAGAALEVKARLGWSHQASELETTMWTAGAVSMSRKETDVAPAWRSGSRREREAATCIDAAAVPEGRHDGVPPSSVATAQMDSRFASQLVERRRFRRSSSRTRAGSPAGSPNCGREVVARRRARDGQRLAVVERATGVPATSGDHVIGGRERARAAPTKLALPDFTVSV